MLGLLLGALWLWVLWTWTALHPGLHADALYLPDLLQSLQAGRGLGGWDLPPAPSLVPDLGLVWLSQLWAENLPQAQRVVSLSLGFGFWVLLARLLRGLLGLDAGNARAYSAAGLLLVLALQPLGTGIADWLLPGHHGLALLISLGLWVWGLHQRDQPSSWARSLGLGLFLGLCLQSDRVLWVWGALPLGFLALRLKRPGQLRVLALLTLAAVTAWLAAQGLAASGARVAQLRWGFIAQRDAAAWLDVLRQGPDLLAAHKGLGLAAGAALLLWAWPREGRHSGPRVLLLGWALAALGSLLLASLLGSFSARYLTLVFVLPAALLPVLAAERFTAWDRAALLLPALAGLLWAAALQSPAVPVALQRAQALDALLAERGLRYGWADYWQARPLRLLSAQGTVCAPMISGEGRVDPYLWIGERELLMQGDVLTRPQFVVSNGLDPQALQARLGTPPEIVTVQDLTVWLLVKGAR